MTNSTTLKQSQAERWVVNATLLRLWFFQPGYAQGVFWITLVSLISNMNDIMMKMLSVGLPGIEIAFFRSFLSMMILIPVMFYQGTKSFQTARPGLHVLRALLGVIAFTCWATGVSMVPLAMTATVALTVPLFVLPLAYLLLNERVGWQRTLATIAGFIGVLIISMPSTSSDQSLAISSTVNVGALILIVASLSFALSDILNKKMVQHENALAMLFYFAFGTSIAGLIPCILVWQMPSATEWMWLCMLGLGSNLILYCLLKAFAAVDVSALAPYRYVELVSAGILGFLLFGELPGQSTFWGALIIIPSTFAIAYYETQVRKRERNLS